MTKTLTKETIEAIKEVVIDVALIEFNILDRNKYWEVAQNLENNKNIKISGEEANIIFECIYKYIEYNKIRYIDTYIEIIRSIIKIV